VSTAKSRLAFALVLVAAAFLQGCEREPVRTQVLRPHAAAPDRTGREGHAPEPEATPPLAHGSQSIPSRKAPDTAALPEVHDAGDALGAQWLAQRTLMVPVIGIAPARLSDNFEQSRGKRKHEAMDIMAREGTPVVAVDNGRITKLFTSKPGGLTIYQYDPTGRLAYYYAHLQRYADGVHEGMELRQGDVIGYVGHTGNADARAPHLHFAVFRLGTPPKWWQGDAVNPYPALSRAQPAEQVAAR
jgi:murein DD-endopeptidase MepM/ murein hydrolase activator NlpD